MFIVRADKLQRDDWKWLCKNTDLNYPGWQQVETHFVAGPWHWAALLYQIYLDVILPKLLPMFKYSIFECPLLSILCFEDNC